MSSMEFRADLRQSQTLSPRLQRAVQLLQMSSLDFAAMVREQLGRNPFLESEDEADGTGHASPGSDVAAPPASGETASADEAPSTHEAYDAVQFDGGDDRSLWISDGLGSGRRLEEGEGSAMELTAADTTLAMHLHGQLNLLPLPMRDLMLARAVVESLDDDGYLRTPLDEVAALVDLMPAATVDEALIALRRVQSLEPMGVGARNVAECLQLQLPRIDDAHLRQLARAIVHDHMDALAARDVPALAARLGASVPDVEQAVARIRRLDPRPGWRHGPSRIDYVVPDVIVQRHRGHWTVQLNPAVVPRVRLNRVYADLLQRHRSPQHRELAGHLQDARWTLRNVEQRFSTILDVAEAIVRRQRHFLEFGPMAMKPLVLRDVADEVGIHESTVSRVTNNKYMATPLGVFELKYFFSRPMMSASGSACSATAIRGLVGDIIAAEVPAHPLSDAEITRQLARQGLVVARRTVTKYRQMLRIDPVDKRRRHAG